MLTTTIEEPKRSPHDLTASDAVSRQMDRLAAQIAEAADIFVWGLDAHVAALRVAQCAGLTPRWPDLQINQPA